ncbi:hypothetical protein [Heyndrickxia oleronia]|uniref:hypothetical protein n=1 Tax=Heyndrickxia oleronia TaxID=38875 RepID=UPI001C0EF7F0|nr:hypothetical protein [Heyndrickxia oleronia]MBU5214285.1 hypothetical protein [Heyndrickxia oleronia]
MINFRFTLKYVAMPKHTYMPTTIEQIIGEYEYKFFKMKNPITIKYIKKIDPATFLLTINEEKIAKDNIVMNR